MVSGFMFLIYRAREVKFYPIEENNQNMTKYNLVTKKLINYLIEIM